jgi:hypothetical protein
VRYLNEFIEHGDVRDKPGLGLAIRIRQEEMGLS